MFARRRIEHPPSFDELIRQLPHKGFTVDPVPGAAARYRISKGDCAAVIENAAGHPRFVEHPGLVIDGEIATLEDEGFQKFLITRARGRQPALAEHLRKIQQFRQELLPALRLPSLYNESLGTVSDVYYYDRLEGRR